MAEEIRHCPQAEGNPAFTMRTPSIQGLIELQSCSRHGNVKAHSTPSVNMASFQDDYVEDDTSSLSSSERSSSCSLETSPAQVKSARNTDNDCAVKTATQLDVSPAPYDCTAFASTPHILDYYCTPVTSACVTEPRAIQRSSSQSGKVSRSDSADSCASVEELGARLLAGRAGWSYASHDSGFPSSGSLASSSISGFFGSLVSEKSESSPSFSDKSAPLAVSCESGSSFSDSAGSLSSSCSSSDSNIGSFSSQTCTSVLAASSYDYLASDLVGSVASDTEHRMTDAKGKLGYRSNSKANAEKNAGVRRIKAVLTQSQSWDKEYTVRRDYCW